MVAPCVIDGAVDGEMFLAYIEQILVPELQTGDTVIMDNLGFPQSGRGETGNRGRGCQPPLSAALQSRYEPDRDGILQTEVVATRKSTAHNG